jgi:hypothetical protein
MPLVFWRELGFHGSLAWIGVRTKEGWLADAR